MLDSHEREPIFGQQFLTGVHETIVFSLSKLDFQTLMLVLVIDTMMYH